MGKGLSLDIGMNTREVVKGSADIEHALDGVSDTLDDLARDGDHAADKLERSFTGALRDISQESRRSGQQVARNIEKSTSTAKESLRELKTEGVQNLAETLSSTDGSVSGFVGGLQGTLGGVVAGLSTISGGAAAAGAAGAIGLGLITAELARQDEATRKLRERFSNLYKDAVDDSRAFLTEAQIQAEVMDLMWNTDRVNEYKDAQKAAKDTGVDLITVLRGLSGDQGAANDVLAVSSKQLADVTDKVDKYTGAVQGGRNPVLESLLEQQSALEKVRNKYADVIEVQGENADKATDAQRVIEGMEAAAREQIKRTQSTEQARWEAQAAAYQKAASRPPVSIPSTIASPDVPKTLKKIQSDINRRPELVVKVGLKPFGRTS